jgi:molybdopterin converting factor small subunit
MKVVVNLPASLRQHSGGAGQWCMECDEPLTLAALFERMQQDYPGIVERALDERGRVREHVNVFVDGTSIRTRQGLQTRVHGGTEVWILPAVSGGQGTD